MYAYKLCALAFLAAIAGCATPVSNEESSATDSVYKEVVQDLMGGGGVALPNEIYYDAIGRKIGEPSPPESFASFVDVLDGCVRKLEDETRGRSRPNKVLATIQVVECASESNWKIEVQPFIFAP